MPRASLTPAAASAWGSSDLGAHGRQQPCPEAALPIHHAVMAPAVASAGGRAWTEVWGINGSPGRCWFEAGGCTWGCSQAEKPPLSHRETFLNYYYYYFL